MDQVFSVSPAQVAALSVWQLAQGVGTFNDAVAEGVMNLKVWLRTFTFAMVCSIWGMWHDTHSLPALPA